MHQQTIAEIESLRNQARGYGLRACFCFTICGWAASRVLHYLGAGQAFWAVPGMIGMVLLGWSGGGYLRLGWERFKWAWADFYRRRYTGLFDELVTKDYDLTDFHRKYAFSKWAFWRAKDLVKFEETLCDYIISYRRAGDLARRRARWEAANAKLTKQLEVLLDEFQITGAEREEIVDNFSSYDNPRRRREFIDGLCNRLVYDHWREHNQWLVGANDTVVAGQVEDYEPLGIEDMRLRSLEVQASKVTSESAQQYYREALTIDSRREKIRLFKRALSEDVSSALIGIEVAAAMSTISETPSKALVNEVKYLSLQDFARERLVDIAGVITPSTIDWRMCREIVLALARPGQSGGRFNKHYFAEDTVKKMVRRQCNIYGEFTFQPTNFDEAVSWLLKNGVLVTKPKVDERTLSLSTNVKNATSAGAHIVSTILRLKREMSGLSS